MSSFQYLLYSVIVAAILSICYILTELYYSTVGFTFVVFAGVLVFFLFNNINTICRRMLAALVSFYISSFLLVVVMNIVGKTSLPAGVVIIAESILKLLLPENNPWLFAYVLLVVGLLAFVEMCFREGLPKLYMRNHVNLRQINVKNGQLVLKNNKSDEHNLRLLTQISIKNNSTKAITIGLKDVSLSFLLRRIPSQNLLEVDIANLDDSTDIITDNATIAPETTVRFEIQYTFNSRVIQWCYHHLNILCKNVDIQIHDDQPHHHHLNVWANVL